MRNRTLFAAPLIIASALLLTGCVQGVVEGAIDDAVSNAAEELANGNTDDTTGQGDTDSESTSGAVLKGTTIPSTWPAAVPLPDGEPTSSLAVPGSMMLQYTLPDAATAKAHVATLEAAGFTTTLGSEGDTSSSYSLTNDLYTVNYNFADSGDGVTQLTQVGVQLSDRQAGPGDLLPSIPANWPSNVPTPPGDVATSNTFENIGIGVSIANADPSAADAYLADLGKSGFETVSESNYEGGSQVTLTDGTYNVTYITADSGDGTISFQVSVTVSTN